MNGPPRPPRRTARPLRPAPGLFDAPAGERAPVAPRRAPRAQPPEFVEPAVTVSEFTRALKGLLADAFPKVRVMGEVSGLHRAPSGHVYFTLKDTGAELRCVMWRPQAERAGGALVDGLSCEVRGAVSVYEPRGTYQLTVDDVLPLGLGALMAALEKLTARLRDEGLFAPERKRPIPRYPRHVGLVTSPTGAAVRDMLRILRERMPGVAVTIVPTLVQGTGAAQQIAAAIDRANRHAACDVLIVGRGGGAIEDLWAFNEEVVARAVARSVIPVVSAVGHEQDVTLIDHVADLRAPTPTGAAQLVVRDRAEVRTELVHLGRRQARGMLTRCRHERQRLGRMTERYGFRQPRDLLRQRAQRVDELAGRAGRALRDRLTRARARQRQAVHHLQGVGPRALRLPQRQQAVTYARTALSRALAARLGAGRARWGAARAGLEALGPLRVLARGYAMVEHVQQGEQGARDDAAGVVTAAAQIRAGMALRVRFHDGSVPAVAGAPELDAAPAPGEQSSGGRDR